MDGTVPSFKKTWFAWEKLRLYYDAVLLAEGLISLWFLRHLCHKVGHLCPNVFGSKIWTMIIIFALTANVLFCLGPGAEIGLGLVRPRWSVRARYLLFAAGLFCSMFIIWACAVRGYTHISGFGR
jgi:hypothetical protein